jgi:hypothetical protein
MRKKQGPNIVIQVAHAGGIVAGSVVKRLVNLTTFNAGTVVSVAVTTYICIARKGMIVVAGNLAAPETYFFIFKIG